MADIKKVQDRLNGFCMIDQLRDYCLDKGHTDVVNDLWGFTHKAQDNSDDKVALKALEALEKTCVQSAVTHVKDAQGDDDVLARIFGAAKSRPSDDSNPLLNALRSIRRHKKNPDFVFNNAKVLNKLFPSKWARPAKDTAKAMGF